MPTYFFFLLVSVLIAQCHCANVRLYKNPGFKGPSLNLTMDYENHDNCINLPTNWMNTVSSINGDNLCIELYSAKHCQGRKFSLYPGTRHDGLSYWMFDKQLVSLKVCDEPLNNEHENRNTLIVYVKNENGGEQYHMNVFSCTDMIPSWKEMIFKIFTYKTCFKFYSRPSCQTILPSPSNPDIITDKNYLERIKSIGSCGPSESSNTITPRFERTQTPFYRSSTKYASNFSSIEAQFEHCLDSFSSCVNNSF